MIDEAAYVVDGVWNANIFPLLSVEATPLIALSTPTNSGNYYTNLFTKKSDDGQPMFNCMQVGLACDDCLEKGNISNCSHKLGDIPHWKGLAQQKEIKSLQTEDAYLTETMGIAVDDGAIKAFERDLIDKLFRLPTWQFNNPVDIVFVCIDPNGGSLNKNASEMAIFSVCRNYNNDFVVNRFLLLLFITCLCTTKNFMDLIHDKVYISLVYLVRAFSIHCSSCTIIFCCWTYYFYEVVKSFRIAFF